MGWGNTHNNFPSGPIPYAFNGQIPTPLLWGTIADRPEASQFTTGHAYLATDENNGTLYVCILTEDSEYSWVTVSSGGGGGNGNVCETIQAYPESYPHGEDYLIGIASEGTDTGTGTGTGTGTAATDVCVRFQLRDLFNASYAFVNEDAGLSYTIISDTAGDCHTVASYRHRTTELQVGDNLYQHNIYGSRDGTHKLLSLTAVTEDVLVDPPAIDVLTAKYIFSGRRANGSPSGSSSFDDIMEVGCDGTVRFVTLNYISANSVTYTTSSQRLAGIALTSGQIIVGSSGSVPTARSMSGDGTLSDTGVLTIANDAITPAKMDNGTALSVLGRSTNTSGDRADIAVSSDHQVLRRSGTTLAFGPVALNQANAVTGTLARGNGGTGLSAAGTSGNVLTSNGTDWASSAPPVTTGGMVVLGGNYTISAANDTWVAPSSGGVEVEFTVPATGTYLIHCDVAVSVSSAAGDAIIEARLYDETAGAALTNSERRILLKSGDGVGHQVTGPMTWRGSLTSGNVVRLEVRRRSSTSWTSSLIIGVSGAMNTVLVYNRVA